MIITIWKNLWRLSVGKRSSSSFIFSLKYYKDIVNLLFWVLWACLATWTQSDTINLKKTFVFICRQNIKFTPPPFLEILQRYTNFLFWVPWACLVAHTQNESINLQKTSMLICMPKINFINHFFLEILHFKESFNLIGWHHLAHNSRTRIFSGMGLVVKHQQH